MNSERTQAGPEAYPANILLVDDEARNLDALESLLQSPDYRLVRALTAEDALRLLLREEFAVIVLDIQMPGTTGLELAHLIKREKRTQGTPIIFLTAYFRADEDVLQGYGTGAVDYLTRPVNPQILRSKIAVFVDLFRKTRALELEIDRRELAEEALRHANRELEARVQARTADLVLVNEELREHETALRASEAQAMAASRAKDDFMAALEMQPFDVHASRPRRILPRRILLVEDHKPTALVLRHLLTRRNYAVVATASLAEARAVAGRENFELLISDIGLPDGTGYELMAELHGRHGLVGIALTGYGMEEDVSRSQAAGFVAHLTKPVSVEALDGALAAATDRLNT